MKQALLCTVAALGIGLFAAESAEANRVSFGFSYGYNNFNRGGFYGRPGCFNRGPVHPGIYRNNFNHFNSFNRGFGHPFYGPNRGGVHFYYRGW